MRVFKYLIAALLTLASAETLIAENLQQRNSIAQLMKQVRVNTPQVMPIWIYEDWVTLRQPMYSTPAFHINFNDGKSMLLGHSGSRVSTFSILQNETVPSVPALGGFPMWSQFVSNQSFQVLAKTADKALLLISDGDGDFPRIRQDIVLINSVGRALWARSLRAERAQFLRNGDVLLQNGAELSRLVGASGAPIWQLNLMELDTDTSRVETRYMSEPNLDTTAPESVVLSIRLERSPRNGSYSVQTESLLVDAATGAAKWRILHASSANQTEGSYPACQAVVRGNVVISFETQVSLALAIVARDLTTGTELWRTLIASNSSGPCASIISDEAVFIGYFGQMASQLVKLQWDGNLLWQRSSPAIPAYSPVQLLLDSQRIAIIEGNPARAQVFQNQSGNPLWAAPLATTERETGSSFRLTANEIIEEYADSNAELQSHLRRVRYSASTGLEMSAESIPGQQLSAKGATVSIVGDSASDRHLLTLRPSFGADERTLTLRKLDPSTGAVAQSVSVSLGASIESFESAVIVRATANAAVVLVQSIPASDGTRMFTLTYLEMTSTLPRWVREFRAFNAGSIHQDATQVVLSLRQCGLTCSPENREQYLRAFDVGLGTQRFSFLKPHFAAIVLNGKVVLQNASSQIESINEDGTLQWTHSISGLPGFPVTSLMTLSNFGSDIIYGVLDRAPSGGNRQTRLVKISGASGQLLWQRIFDAHPNSSIVLRKTPDGLMYSINFTGPPFPSLTSGALYYLDPISGATRFQITSGDSYFHSVRPILDGSNGSAAIRQTRGLLAQNSLSHFLSTVQTLNYQSGTTGAEHVYVANIDNILAANVSATLLTPAHSEDVYAVAALENSDVPFSFQRWPTVSVANAGDLRITTAAEFNPYLTGLGPNAQAEFVVRNDSTQSVTASIGYLDDSSGSHATLHGCQASPGSSCPDLGSVKEFQSLIAPNGHLHLNFEIADPSFAQNRLFSISSPPAASGQFYALPHYTFGDRLMSNNFLGVTVNTAGYGDGFE